MSVNQILQTFHIIQEDHPQAGNVCDSNILIQGSIFSKLQINKSKFD